MMQADRQQTIVDWFDSVYRRKGTAYLRPVEAYLVFMELLGARSEHKLLDVACGPGVLLEAASGYTHYLHGIDISEVAVAQARRRLRSADVEVGNAETLPYKTGTFDLITCLGSLERMLNPSRALEEMKRVGKPAAKYCFLVRNSNTFTWRYLAPIAARQRATGHAGADTLGNWRLLFESHGFRVADVLPDQYPLQRRQRWASLFLKPVDFRRPLSSRAPLERANEFVFLLEKRP
jgi:SAM-dependent methyltransferase